MSFAATAVSDEKQVWQPRESDQPQRGSISVFGSDPEPFSDMEAAGILVTSANRRTLYCRDDAHGQCKGSIHTFDFQFRRPFDDPCGCPCHAVGS